MKKPDATRHNPDPDYARSLIESAGMTIRAAAIQIGASERSLRHWLAGNGTLPYPVQYALEALGGR